MRSRSSLSLALVVAGAVALGIAASSAGAALPTAPVRVRAASLKPVFGHTIVVTRVSGSVFVIPAGRHVRQRVEQPQAIRSGSVIDLKHGDATIETAAQHGRATYIADVSGAALRVTQPRSGGGLTNLAFVNTPHGCRAAHAANLVGPARVTATAHHRHRYARDAGAPAVGQFRLVAKDGSAVNRTAATYEGTEGCGGTKIADRNGSVSTAAADGAGGDDLDPGETWQSRCSTTPVSPTIGPYCLAILGSNSHGYVNYTTGLFTKTTATTFDLCQTTPSTPQTCQPWGITTMGDFGEQEGLVSCPVLQAGTYQLSWEIDGTPLGPPMLFTSTAVSHHALPCNGFVGTPFSTGNRNLELPSGVKVVNSYSLATASWLEDLTVDLTGRGGGQESLTGVVYQDAGGHPGALVGATQPCVVKGRDTSDCDVLSFSPEVNVPAGTYWFGLLTGGKSNVALVQESHTAVAQWDENPLSAASDPFGTARTIKVRMSLQAHYSLDPPPASPTATPPASG
jgi:hypothetical protein